MSDQVHFQEAWTVNVPMVGLDGDLMFQEAAGFGVAVKAFFQAVLSGLKAIIQGSSADALKLPLLRRAEWEAFANPGVPEAEDFLQANGPRVAGFFPDGFDDFEQRRAIGWGARRPRF